MADNPGIIPFKLGNAKVQEYSYTLINFYDLNPIILEINKLHSKSLNLTQLISNNTQYYQDASNYIKILTLIKERVERKIKGIIPHPERTKRGLINGLGSIFKSITGNLDSADGEKYEKLIFDLQNNQHKLASSTLKQNSLSLNIIEKFNVTIQHINHNEKLLESKLNQIALIIQKSVYRENSAYIKDVLNQIINVYEIIDSTLQDIENSITFSKLKILHNSIISTEELYSELQKIQNQVGLKQMPLEASLENTLILEKIIKLECFVLNNKITHLLQIPITYPGEFDYFHLFSIPIFGKSLFKVIIPKDKFLLKNQLHFSYRNLKCQEVKTQFYVCDETDLQEISDNSPCTVKLLESKKNVDTCMQIETKISKPIIRQFDKTNQWALILPKKEIVRLQCRNQDERRHLLGTYLIQIPDSCNIVVNQETIIYNQKPISTQSQPILFPDFDSDVSLLPTLNLSVHLDQVKLDELYKLKNEIQENEPQLFFDYVHTTPSIWTICTYIICVFAISFYCFRKRLLLSQRKGPAKQTETIELQDVQLPR